MEHFDGGVYSEAKGEYTRQLTLFIVPAFHRFFMECIDQAAVEEPQAKKQLWKFQELISQVPEWNMDKVHREVQRLTGLIQCDYLEELVTAVFIAHTKVLTAIRIGNKNKRVQITIPKLEHFLHRSLSECSRLLWSSAYLFHNELSPIDRQKNHRQIEQLLHEGILQAIRGLLPVKNILKDYLAEPDAADDAEDDDDAETKDEKDEKKPSEEPKEKDAVQEADKELIQIVESQSQELTKPAAPEHGPESPSTAKPSLVVKEDTPPSSLIPEPEVAPVQPPQPPQPQQSQTVVVQTEPSVRFTDFDQVIQQSGGETRIGYVEKDRAADELEQLRMMEDGGEPLNEFDDLTQGELLPMEMGDFEVLQ